MSEDGQSVLVTGDFVQDRYIYEGQLRRPGSQIRLGTSSQETPGGAALLEALLRSLGDSPPGRFVVSCGFDIPRIMATSAKGFCVMRPYQKYVKGHDKDPKGKMKAWRIAEPLGFGAGEDDLNLAAVNATALAAEHRIVVLDDAGLLFRRWPAQTAWPRFLVDATRPLPEWLVIKLSGPVASGDLWHTIVSGQTQDNVPTAVRSSTELCNRSIAVVSINDLRTEPLLVSRNLSWERAALDLVDEFRVNPHLNGLRALRFVVVSLNTDGAMIFEFPPAGQSDTPPRYRLVFDPSRLEGDFGESLDGGLVGFQTGLTAAIVSQLLSPQTAPGEPPMSVIERGVRMGLCAMRRLLVDGHGPVVSPPATGTPGFPFTSLTTEIQAATHEWAYGAVDVPESLKRTDAWTIIAGRSPSRSSRGAAIPLFGLARRAALHGRKQLQQTPYLQFGKLFSVERTEIESLRTLHRLLKSYQSDPKADKPLSIAAFGPPGSGKSFGVKQLAKAVFADDTPPLEFNLAQFKDATELHGLFHQIRDAVLRGKLPVVFWDEFDSRNLEWLQYLLGPMQDGTFQEGQVTHPIGKCVFVFAGGTKSRFEDFGVVPDELVQALDAAEKSGATDLLKELTEKRDAIEMELKLKKAPDFKSRLAGYINVLGPNPRDGEDITYPVRRALLLRVHLGIEDLNVVPKIDAGLLNAFLRIEAYRHGSRSLEKIAEQVRLNSRTGEFTRSDLPAHSQLELHVNADRFLELVEQET